MNRIIVAYLKEEEIPFNGKVSQTIEPLTDSFLRTLCLMMNSKDIDASMISDTLFEIKNANIFISYSHNDINCAKKLASFLKQFGVSVFLDCEIWKSSDEFLAKIDREYAYQREKDTYDYKIRNRTTAHAHAILSVSLFRQIVKSDCMIVLNPESNLINKESNIIKTQSPWIYEEVMFAKNLIEHNKITFLEHATKDQEPIPINYKLPLKGCNEINYLDLNRLNSTLSKLNQPKNVSELINVLLNHGKENN